MDVQRKLLSGGFAVPGYFLEKQVAAARGQNCYRENVFRKNRNCYLGASLPSAFGLAQTVYMAQPDV